MERGERVERNMGRARTPPTMALKGTAMGQGEGASEKGVLMMGGKKRTGSFNMGASGSSKVGGLSMKIKKEENSVSK